MAKKLFTSSGITITAISTSFIAIGGGKKRLVRHDPAPVSVAFGYAYYFCLNKLGKIGNRDGVYYHLKISDKNFFSITKKTQFEKCLIDQSRGIRKKIRKKKIEAIVFSIFTVVILYFIFIFTIIIAKWIINGFKS
tara:strand:- start:201 stop:608 length:408 start_codon:yes stop_codon:yes gene_type:complete